MALSLDTESISRKILIAVELFFRPICRANALTPKTVRLKTRSLFIIPVELCAIARVFSTFPKGLDCQKNSVC